MLMSNGYDNLNLITESDVEQKLIYKLLTTQSPIGLGYADSDFQTKNDIRQITIGKGNSKKLYFPDYAIIIDGIPIVIIEAKAPDEDLNEAVREARLYATEINSNFPRNINPCSRIIVTDGITVTGCHWDENTPCITLKVTDLSPINEAFVSFCSFASKIAISTLANDILKSIRKNAKYLKPVHMLGGKSITNESVGENSFGSNISLEYKHLFNPESIDDRNTIAKNAYVSSRRKLSHVSPIDKIIRATLPSSIINSNVINDTNKPIEIFDKLVKMPKPEHEMCLLIGSVGSGKSTFTDYLREVALPESLRNETDWININLNKAPLTKDKIYDWIVWECVKAIKAKSPDKDYDHIDTLLCVYSKELNRIKKGRASLYPRDSEKYTDIIYEELKGFQSNGPLTLTSLIDYTYTGCNKSLIVVLDNCDKRLRDDQLLMFEVATWLKNTFLCMIFLPLRDSTYDQYCNAPPLDTVIKDLVFRIDPPLLEKVIYARLNYALREIDKDTKSFIYYLPNNYKVECKRNEVGVYLSSMVRSLFQDNLFRRIITGLAGRNIRKGLEILLDFCKSGHILESEILKIRQSNGSYCLPPYLIMRILLRAKRKYYSDEHSYIKNLFFSDPEDSLPDPFVRISILQWLKDKYRVFGPNKTKGYHKVDTIIKTLQANGHSNKRITKEIDSLIQANCIIAESLDENICSDDLVTISPSGFIHLDLLRNISCLAAIAEDTYFRENQVAKNIANNLIGDGVFAQSSRQADIGNSKLLLDYMALYFDEYFLGSNPLLADESREWFINIHELKEYVRTIANNDPIFSAKETLLKDYPPGSWTEAQVARIQPYGIFAEFGLSGLGLIHQSNFQNVDSKKIEKLEEGDWIIVEIVRFNIEHDKFDLRLVDA
jgi:hypothetical protein